MIVSALLAWKMTPQSINTIKNIRNYNDLCNLDIKIVEKQQELYSFCDFDTNATPEAFLWGNLHCLMRLNV